MSYLSRSVSSGCAVRRFHVDAHDRHGRLPKAGRRSAIGLGVDTEREPLAVEDGAERDDIVCLIDDKPKVGELVAVAIVV